MIRKVLPCLMLLLLLPLSAMAQRPYTGKVITDYNGMMDTDEGVYRGWMQDHGSFVVISPSHVLTNFHVVKEYLAAVGGGQADATLTLRFFEGDELEGEVVATDVMKDLALVQFDDTVPDGVYRIGIAQTFAPKTLTIGGYPLEGFEYAEDTVDSWQPSNALYFKFPAKAVIGQVGFTGGQRERPVDWVALGSGYPDEIIAYGTDVVKIRKFLRSMLRRFSN